MVRRVAGYKKIRYYTHENVGYGPVNLPDHEMPTTALWWELSQEALERHFDDRQGALDGFLGAAYALHHVAALVSMAELRDLGRAVGDGASGWSAVVGPDGRGALKNLDGRDAPDPAGRGFRPTVFLYDNYPGGIGLAAPLFEQRGLIVRRAAELVAGCVCSDGCPACVGPVLPRAGDPDRSPKRSALAVLRLLGSPRDAGRASDGTH